jgi:ribosomal protein L11 methyltransferase
VAAARLGAASVGAVDTDPASVSSTQENCELNQVLGLVEVEQGSLHTILAGRFDSPQAPLMVANILASVILGLFESGLADAVEPEGILLLSGILEDQVESILQKAGECGLTHLETRLIEDWAAIALKK